MSKFLETNMKIINDVNINSEIKLFCILSLVYHENISLYKAYELCTETGIFSKHWMAIDSETTEIWEKFYNTTNA